MEIMGRRRHEGELGLPRDHQRTMLEESWKIVACEV